MMLLLQEQTLQFLGHKATQDLNPSNPYKVAPVTVRISSTQCNVVIMSDINTHVLII